MSEMLTDAWAKAWGEALNASASYRAVAASWEGAVLVTVRGDPGRGVEERAVFLDLWHGTCREARAARQGRVVALRAPTGGPPRRATLAAVKTAHSSAPRFLRLAAFAVLAVGVLVQGAAGAAGRGAGSSAGPAAAEAGAPAPGAGGHR